MKKGFLIIVCFLSFKAHTQEFKKNSQALNLEFLQGFTNPKELPALYLADLRLSYQYSIQKGIGIGATAGVMYNNNTTSVFGGPNVAVLLKQFSVGQLGSIANVHLLAEHLWGTKKQKLLGGGVRMSIGNQLLLSLLTHRDYGLNYWNFQFGLGYQFIHEKIKAPVIN